MRYLAFAFAGIACSLLCARPVKAACGMRPASLFPALLVWGICLVLSLLPLIPLVRGRKKESCPRSVHKSGKNRE